MYIKEIDTQIIFYYPHGELFEDVQHMSAYMCKNIATKEGEDLSENFAITGDEEDMFRLCLREALPQVYDYMKVLTYGIENALYDDILGSDFEQWDPDIAALDLPANEHFVVIRTNDHSAYNPNDLKLADSAILSAIEQGVIAEFYENVLEKDLTQVSAARFAAQLTTLGMRIMPLRKKVTL